jgi:hypothetical protein
VILSTKCCQSKTNREEQRPTPRVLSSPCFFFLVIGRRDHQKEMSCHGHTENCTNSLALCVGTCFSFSLKISDMAVTTHFDNRVNRQRRQTPETAAQPNLLLEGQNDPLPPLQVPSPSNIEQNQTASLEAHIVLLIEQNAELLLRTPEQSHSEINWEDHEEEQRTAGKENPWQSTMTRSI